jgi:hypothetical protein
LNRDERSLERKMIDLQEECFRRMDVMKETIAELRAELTAERRSRAEDICKLRADHSRITAELKTELKGERKAQSNLRAELRADRRARESTDCKLTAHLTTERRSGSDLRTEFDAILEAVAIAVRDEHVRRVAAAVQTVPALRERFYKFNGNVRGMVLSQCRTCSMCDVV